MIILLLQSMRPFIRDVQQLEKGLFRRSIARQGVQTTLNINYLPDLLQHIKTCLTAQESLTLQEYHLQNYLVQLAIRQEAQVPDLSVLVEHILGHIRGSNNFWYRHNNQQVLNEEQKLKNHAIDAYHQDATKLKSQFQEKEQKMESFEPQYPRRTGTNFCFKMLHQVNQPHFGTKCSLNHLAHVPRFLLNRQQKALQADSSKVNPDDDSSASEKRQMLQECVMFMLSNKPSKTAMKEAMRQEEDSISRGSGQSQNSQPEEHKQTIFDQFEQFIEGVPSLPAYQNSSHMLSLTINFLRVAEHVLNKDQTGLEKPEEEEIIGIPHRTEDSLETLSLDSKTEQVMSKISDSELEEEEVQLLASGFLQFWRKILKPAARDWQQKAKQDSSRGWISSPVEVSSVKAEYQAMLTRPEFLELTQYRTAGASVPWKDEDYLNFLKGLNEFINVPTNNKKIASLMGSKIEPNHVKHVKGVYLSVMKDRMERGECGGGKRGKCLGKSDFLEKDIETFSMKWFEKSKKIRKRKLKKRRRLSESDPNDDQIDSDF